MGYRVGLLKGGATTETFLKLFVICAPALLGAVFSFWNLPALGLSWWDEHDYVSTAKWFLGRADGVFTIYEPPGFPFFMSLMFRLMGVRDFVAIATSGVFAVLTLLLVAYIGFRWFGYGVAVAAGMLLAVNSLFLTFARFAMADMTFTFFFTAAVFSLYLAMKSRMRRDLVIGAICFVCCASIKYNGFMAFLIPLAYIPILVTGQGQRIRAALRDLLTLLAMGVPAALAGVGYFALLGVGGSVHRLFSLRTLKIVAGSLPSTIEAGFSKFMIGAVQHSHGSQQLLFIPFSESVFYVETLGRFVQWPLFIPLVVGIVALVPRLRRQGEAQYLFFWLAMAFFLISSIPIQLPRAIVPLLPPMSLVAGFGVVQLPRIFPKSTNKLNARLDFRQVIAGVLLVVILLASSSSMVQTVNVAHQAYRETGQILDSMAGGSPVLAETQLVLAFYYPVDFRTGLGPPTNATLSKHQFLVVDFEASALGYDQTIQGLEREGRITLVASIPNDAPEIVYLDSMNITQYAKLNGTFIYIYRVNNTTQVGNG